MRRALWVFLAVLIIIPIVSSAQYDEGNTSKIIIRGGVHRPSGSAMKYEAALWPEIGIDYILRYDKAQKPKEGVSAVYTSVSKNLMDAKLMGLEYMRYWSKSPIPDKGVYFGAGAGVFSAKAKLDVNFDRWVHQPEVIKSGTKLGLSVLAGYHLGEFWLVEIRYTKLRALAEDVDPSGLSLFVGAKRIL